MISLDKCADFKNINTEQDLTTFLKNLYQSCQRYLSINSPNFVENWREAWHPDRVAVYSQVVTKSEVVELFHNSTFKHTPAIGGRNINDKRPTFISSIWHRMLPIENNQYLEIVTIFHGDRQPWQHSHQGDQLQPFINSIVKKGLQLSWGKKP
jgi:CRISPR-associated protein Cmr6